MFSLNVQTDKQAQLSALLGVHNDISSSHYLGLPSLVARSKREFLAMLRIEL